MVITKRIVKGIESMFSSKPINDIMFFFSRMSDNTKSGSFSNGTSDSFGQNKKTSKLVLWDQKTHHIILSVAGCNLIATCGWQIVG